ncbi:MAG: histidine kinase dimerization/phosphoacceptor domain -containing protein [Euryarchaeota archaeon]
MNIYAKISLLAFIVCFFLANFIYHKDSSKTMNKLVAALCLIVGLLSFIEFQYRQAYDYETALFWLRVSTIWPIVPSILLHISLIFTDHKNIFKSKLAYLAIYLPAIIIISLSLTTNLLLDGASQQYWGWTYEFPQNPLLFNLMSIWTLFAGFTAGTLCFIYYLKSYHIKRLQAKYIFTGLYLPLIVSLISDLVLPATSLRVPEMTMAMSTVGITFISYGIWKHKFPALTSAVVADKIVSTMSNFLLILDQNRDILTLNQAAADILEYEEQELVGKQGDIIFAQKNGLASLLKSTIDSDLSSLNSLINKESQLKTKKGEIIPVILSLSPIVDENSGLMGIVCIGSDIKDLKKAEDKIRTSLEEKEVLLQEVHHRVKNNLQIISSLLNLQSRYIQDEGDLELFRDSQSRVKSMAIIHEKLYKSNDFAHVDFKEYISSLTAYLFHYYSIDPDIIKLEVEVDNLMLSMDTAIPCGLIINELVSNSLKYAFPPGREGKVSIKLQSKNDQFLLEVADDGVGLPENLDFKKSESLGLRLVLSLTSQINGNIKLIDDSGTKYEINFFEIEYKDRF